MRIVRDVPHPNSYTDCVQLFNTRRHPRSYTPYYLPITDALVLVHTDPGSIAVVNEGIPLITFRNDDTALINSCGLLQDFPPRGNISPIMDTLFNRLSYCLHSTNWTIHTPTATHGFRLVTFPQPVMTAIYHDFKDFSIIKLGTNRIWQPSPSSQVITRFQNTTVTPATTPSPVVGTATPFTPDPRLRGATISAVGTAMGDHYWIRAVPTQTPTPPTQVVLPNGQFAASIGLLESYHWTSLESANAFIESIRRHFESHPTIPRSPLITQETHFSIRGPVPGPGYPHPYWISVSNPNRTLHVLHPTGEVDTNTGVPTLYGWDTAEEARTFIQSLLSQPPVLTCPIEMPVRRTP